MNRTSSFQIYALVAILLCAISETNIHAQQYGNWTEVTAELELTKKIELGLGVEARSVFTNGYLLDQFFPELGISYKINKYLDASMSYRHAFAREDNDYYYARSKYYGNFSFDFPVERFKIKNRIRYQWQYKYYQEDDWDAIPDNYLRNKTEISYNIKKTPIEPFISYEIYYPLNAFEINTINEYRFSGGIEFPLKKNHSMDIGLLYNVERFPVIEKQIVLLIGYKFSVN